MEEKGGAKIWNERGSSERKWSASAERREQRGELREQRPGDEAERSPVTASVDKEKRAERGEGSEAGSGN